MKPSERLKELFKKNSEENPLVGMATNENIIFRNLGLNIKSIIEYLDEEWEKKDYE